MICDEEKNIFKIDRRGVVKDVDTANLSTRSFSKREKKKNVETFTIV